MAEIIGFKRVADAGEVTAIMTQYTHSDGCGYTRAWTVADDPSLIMYMTNCPVEAVIMQLQALIAIFVEAAYAVAQVLNGPSVDKHVQALQIVKSVNDSVQTVLLQGITTESIALFLQGGKVHDMIISEMISQGVMSDAI